MAGGLWDTDGSVRDSHDSDGVLGDGSASTMFSRRATVLPCEGGSGGGKPWPTALSLPEGSTPLVASSCSA